MISIMIDFPNGDDFSPYFMDIYLIENIFCFHGAHPNSLSGIC